MQVNSCECLICMNKVDIMTLQFFVQIFVLMLAIPHYDWHFNAYHRYMYMLILESFKNKWFPNFPVFSRVAMGHYIRNQQKVVCQMCITPYCRCNHHPFTKLESLEKFHKQDIIANFPKIPLNLNTLVFSSYIESQKEWFCFLALLLVKIS